MQVKNKKRLLVASLLVGTVLVSGAALSSGGKHKMRCHTEGARGEHSMISERMIDKMSDHLELTQTQVEQLRAIADENRSKQRQLADQLRDNRKALHSLVEQDPLDEANLRSLSDTLGGLTSEMTTNQLLMMASVKSILNEEQREKMQQMKHRYGARGHHGEKGHHGKHRDHDEGDND